MSSVMKRLVDPDEAMARVLAEATPLPPQPVSIEESQGLVLAEDVCADRAYPPFDRAMMDGYAVRMGDAGRRVRVAGEVMAGELPDFTLCDGFALSIMTGAPCPKGAEAVVPKEDVREIGDDVELPDEVPLGVNIARYGSECAPGSIIAVAGQIITPLVIANLATFGYETVMAIPRPSCAVITTGSELVPHGAPVGPAQIRNSNGPMLAAMVREAGARDPVRLHAPDTPKAIRAALEAVEHVDVVALTGGVSVGKYDLAPEALAGYGVEILFHKVSQKPGKPLLFGRKGRCLFFGLPGNPLASHLCFHRYVRPALRRMMGKQACPEWDIEGRLASPVKGTRARTAFLLCLTESDALGWRIAPLQGKGSADIHAPCAANSYIRVNPDQGTIAAGGRVRFAWLRDIE